MKIKNLLWSGCSFSAGSAFTSHPMWLKSLENEGFRFADPKLKKFFKPPFTNGNIKPQINNLTFPILLGNRLGCTTKNLSVAGMGYPIHTRRLFSYVMNNKDSINFEDTVIGLQLTSFQRNEIVKTSPNGNIEFCYMDGTYSDGYSKEHLVKYWNPAYSAMKAINDLILFKGWCDSNKIKIHFFAFEGFLKEQILSYTEDINLITNQINQHELSHLQIDFPNINLLLKELDIIELPIIEHGTFKTEGYHDDTHFSPEGHVKISNILFDIFTKKLNYTI